MEAEIILLERIVFVLAVFLIINRNGEIDFMSNLSAFLAQNVVREENVKYVASKRFVDEGKPVDWELQSVTSEEDEQIRKSCTHKVPIPGKYGQFTRETDYEKYLGLLAAKCIVYPNLNAAELQDSYGVMGADAVLKKMLKPGEYQDLLKKIQEINGFDIDMNALVEEAKN
ncbi:phage tail assembly chaperone [Sporomusa acidovorans]|uniref:Phage XkdN-like protein n=1 Tax=Sporomusa acidovorans (strain ATCC 49682 / DSM 3132 / Mol) TaxID=1123286 RepID=A0ABZ3J6B7_SPOA4|nr:hypothetical protein [Sporomusa acidovorans]OZC23815.1 phage XkdN-like protein [Sporomusa acidovorans DSM 3132]SDF62055.1 Phage XkdN-like tail assembly chaperone protein, TAC [Sporomusa acidovorans]